MQSIAGGRGTQVRFPLGQAPKNANQHLAPPPAVPAFGIAFLGFCLVAVLQGEKPFQYDALSYWDLSHTFTQHGSFSLLNFENTGLRGYSLPLIFHFLQVLGNGFSSNDAQMVLVFNAALFSLIGTVLAPRLAGISWPDNSWGIGRRLVISAGLLVFWRGFLNFPLSDFPALAALLLALISVSSPESPPWMATCGIAAGLALNIRPAYAVVVPVLLVLMALHWFNPAVRARRPYRRLALCIALFTTGLFAISLPQSLSQHQTFGSYNPIPGNGTLASLQYTEGLRLQRYDTFVGNNGTTPRMLYLDPDTHGVIEDLEGGEVQGTSEYLEIAISNPVLIAGVFLRHFVNGLDQRYPTPYIEHLEGSWNRLVRFVGFLIVFLGLVRVLWPAARQALGRACWRYPVALLLSSAAALPSAVETRFLLPVFLLSMMLVTAPGWVKPIGPPGEGPRRFATPMLLIAACVLFYLLVGTIVSGATDNLQLSP